MEIADGKDKTGKILATIGKSRVEGARCAEPTRPRPARKDVCADQARSPPGASHEAEIQRLKPADALQSNEGVYRPSGNRREQGPGLTASLDATVERPECQVG